MNDTELLAERFEEHRGRLKAVAYRMLGSLSEAEDAVQEAWPKLSRSDAGEIENLGGWLTTVVGRICLDMLRSRTRRHEEPLEDTFVPDPVIRPLATVDPEQEVLQADSVGLALLVVLETLEPAERIAFVLHDMFAVPFDDIAPIVERSSAATRQLASRARRRVRGATPSAEPDPGRQRGPSTPSSPPPGPATSRHCSRSSTRMSCCGPTPVRWSPESRRPRWCGVRSRWPNRRCCSASSRWTRGSS